MAVSFCRGSSNSLRVGKLTYPPAASPDARPTTRPASSTSTMYSVPSAAANALFNHFFTRVTDCRTPFRRTCRGLSLFTPGGLWRAPLMHVHPWTHRHGAPCRFTFGFRGRCFSILASAPIHVDCARARLALPARGFSLFKLNRIFLSIASFEKVCPTVLPVGAVPGGSSASCSLPTNVLCVVPPRHARRCLPGATHIDNSGA